SVADASGSTSWSPSASRRRGAPSTRSRPNGMRRSVDCRPSSRTIATMTNTDKRESRSMTKQKTGTREEWLAARLKLLGAEEEYTRRGDDLARHQRALQ